VQELSPTVILNAPSVQYRPGDVRPTPPSKTPKEADLFFGEEKAAPPSAAAAVEIHNVNQQMKLVMLVGVAMLLVAYALVNLRKKAAQKDADAPVVQQGSVVALTPHGTPWAAL
jgi:hypothetical protein